MSHTILEPGRNCWQVARANAFYAIQDAADYFRLVREAILRARESIFILGWDIAGGINLVPGQPEDGAPVRLDRLIAYAARRNPKLHCYILIWDYGSLYTLERDPWSRIRLGWRTPRRVRFGYDDRHPIGGSHHQKVVVVDDALAFCGGIDLTSHRWDTSAHRVEEPARRDWFNTPYEPYHEVQAMVDGAAAVALGNLARDRWKMVGVDDVPAVRASTETIWPDSVQPDMTDADVAIARTIPATGDQPATRECEALFIDSIARARQSIYIESQYFSDAPIADALAARLREPSGPEVILVTPKVCHGWLEQATIGALRGAALRQLAAADAYQRLRVVYPLASRQKDVPTFVHSKVMIVDDTFVRIGSANCSHRSMGVDTECDLAVEASTDRTRSGVLRIRHRLLGEHLGMNVDDVDRALGSAGSLRALVDGCQAAERCLAPIDLDAEPQETGTETLQAAADPDEPWGFGGALERMIPPVETGGGGSPLRLWILPMAAIAAAAIVALASMESPGGLHLRTLQEWLTSWTPSSASISLAVGVFVLASLALVPIELLMIAAGLALGPSSGAVVSAIGSTISAAIGYAAGRAIGPAGLARWMSRKSYRSGRQLGAQGIAGVALLRMAAVGSAGSLHLLCGAGRIPFASYLIGSLLGFIPALAALTTLGALFRYTLLQPSPRSAAVTMGAALALMLVASLVRAFFLIRQFAPSVKAHRRRAEFG